MFVVSMYIDATYAAQRRIYYGQNQHPQASPQQQAFYHQQQQQMHGQASTQHSYSNQMSTQPMYSVPQGGHIPNTHASQGQHMTSQQHMSSQQHMTSQGPHMASHGHHMTSHGQHMTSQGPHMMPGEQMYQNVDATEGFDGQGISRQRTGSLDQGRKPRGVPTVGMPGLANQVANMATRRSLKRESPPTGPIQHRSSVEEQPRVRSHTIAAGTCHPMQ